MSNKIFKTLFEEKADTFSTKFKSTSKMVYYDEKTQKLIHPGEFGIYREKICRDFLKFFIPSKLEIEDGFVINATHEISTQCDLIIYNKNETPLIRSEEHQKFFPVETVVGVGEVKSKLNQNELKDALRKLSELKKIRENISNPMIIDPTRKIRSYDPKKIVIDQIFTFLICDELNFNYKDLVDKFDSIYSEIDQIYWHNLILSIKDGLILYYEYSDGSGSPCPYPIFKDKKLKSCMIPSSANNKNYNHFASFAQHINSLSAKHTTLYIDLFDYLGMYEENYDIILEEDK